MPTLLRTTIAKFNKEYPSVSALLEGITLLSITERKEIISCVQVGRVLDEEKLRNIFSTRGICRFSSGQTYREDPSRFIHALHDVLHSHVHRSLIWMFCRTIVLGHSVTVGGVKYQAYFCLPSLFFDLYDPRKDDWLEYLLENTNQLYYSVPMLDTFRLVPVPDVGEEVIVPKQKGWQVLEDCGYVEIEDLWEIITVFSESKKRKLRWFLKIVPRGELLQLSRVVVLREIPEMFHELLMFLPVLNVDYAGLVEHF